MPAGSAGEVVQLRALGIADLLSTTGLDEGTRLSSYFQGESGDMTALWRRRPPDEDTVVVEPDGVRREEIVEEEPAPPPPPRIWPWLLALLLLVLAGGIAWWLLTRDDGKTTMPRVVGLTEFEARARISDAELEADVDRRQSRRRAGIVFAQTPGAGTQLDEGERVEILVSSGFVRLPVPSVRDLKERDAVERIEQAGFKAQIKRVFAGAPKGDVIEQDPRGGERARRGSTVLLTVSKGRNLNTVPDLIGRTENEAVDLLRAREFEPRIFDVPSSEPRGTVVAQVPQGGEQAPPDSRVRINVSTGEETGEPQERPSEPAPGSTATVPNVVGLGQTNALRRLFAAQLDGVVRYQRSSRPLGRVLAQRPAGGATATRPAQVILTISSGPAPELVDVPDVVGEDEAGAREALEAEGFVVETIRDRTTDAAEGIVLDQQPAAGTRAPSGGVITLWIAAPG
jgi:beta-lactam-binding protein with PASTA domain